MQTSTPLPERAVPASLNLECTLTDRYQTTLPEALSGPLQPGKDGKIRYSILPTGEVLLTRSARPEAEDPLLGQFLGFLGFLACDMASHPERLKVVDARLVQRLQALIAALIAVLIAGIDVDLDSPLPAHAV